MLALYNESEPVDTLTVTDRLRQMGKLQDIGGAATVDELTGVCRPPDTPAATRRSCARTRCCGAC